MDTGSIFPLLDSIHSCLYRKRAKNYPNMPKSIHDLVIFRRLETFLLIDEIDMEQRSETRRVSPPRLATRRDEAAFFAPRRDDLILSLVESTRLYLEWYF